MKIAVLMGSPRKADSWQICQLLQEQLCAKGAYEFTYLFLRDRCIEDCKGCDQCFQKGEEYCPCKDGLPEIRETLLHADGIIFASPVYACQISGTLKRFIDRQSYWFHRQELAGKPALSVVTTGGGGQKPTAKYLKMTASGWGCHLAGGVSVISPMFFPKKNGSPIGYREQYHQEILAKIRRIAESFDRALTSGSRPIPTFYDLLLFQCLRTKTMVSQADYRFWKSKGWLTSSYYYPVKLNPLKAFFSQMARKAVDAMAKRMLTASPSQQFPA